jgi:WD40 repeat protein
LIDIVIGYAGLQEVSQYVVPTRDSDGVTALAALPEGFVTGSVTGSVRFWNDDGTLLRVAAAHSGPVKAFAVTTTGLVVSASSDSAAHVYTLEGEHTIAFIKHRDEVCGVAALSDDTVVSASTDGGVFEWSAKSGQVLQFFLTPAANSCMVSLPDRKLVLGDFDRTVRFLDLDGDGQRHVEGKGHSERMTVGVPLPGGYVATGSLDGFIIVWKDGVPVHRLPCCFESVYALAVLPDGTLASAGPDGDVRVWDWMQGDWLRMLTGPSAPVHALAVLGGTLVAADMSGNITVWQWA